MSRPRIGQVLLEQGVLSAGQVELILAEQQARPGRRFADLALELGLAKDAQIAAALAAQFELQVVPDERLDRLNATPAALALLPPRTLREHRVLPTFIDTEQKVLTLVVADPTDIEVLKQAQAVSRAQRLRLFVASRGGLDQALDRLLPPEEPAPAPEPRHALPTLAIALDVHPRRAAALRALTAADADPSAVAETPAQVGEWLAQGRGTLLVHHRAATPLVEEHLPEWRRLQPRLQVRVVDGWGPAQVPAVPPASGRDFLLQLLEFALLSGEGRHIELRGRIRRTGALARALAQELGLPEGERDAVAVAALLYHAGRLSALGGLQEASDPATGVPLGRHALAIALLEPFHPPWPVIELLRALEARGARPCARRAAEVVYSAAELAARPSAGEDPAAALGPEAEGHDPEVLAALGRVLRREGLRDRLEQEGAPARPLVLLAERDPATVTALEARLSQEGYEVLSVSSGEDAWARARALRPAALIANLRLPGRDGLSLLVELRREPTTAEVPVFLLTDHAGPRDVARGLELGAEDVLVKPVNTAALLTRLRRVATRAAPPTPAAGIRGTLADLPLAELLQTLSLGARTAEVVIGGGPAQGTLHLEQGRVVWAAQGALAGPEAVYALLAQRTGSFEVLFHRPAPGRNVEQPTAALLLEGLRRADEAGRGGG